MLFHSAQKSCQEATWEFPETEIELVLTQAEQKAVAKTWIIVPYKVLAARMTLRHVCHHTLSLQRCLRTVAPKVLFIASVLSKMMFTSTIVAAIFLHLRELQNSMRLDVCCTQERNTLSAQLRLLFI